MINENNTDLLKKEIELKDTQIKNTKLKGWITKIAILFEIVFLTVALFKYFDVGSKLDFSSVGKNKVAIINLDQQITKSYIDRLTKKLEKIKKDKHYKAAILRVSSPGGSPVASEEFSSYIKSFNKKIPTTVYIDEMAASGAYYIASALKPIYANKNAIVGSIGVVMPHYSAQGLAEKLGVKEETITAGKFKKPLSLLRYATEEEKNYLKSNLLLPTYNNFLKDVADNRGIPASKLKEFAEGKIFIANMKDIQNILVDKITHLYELKDKFKKAMGKDIKFVDINANKEKPSIFGVNLSINGIETPSVSNILTRK